MSRAIYHINSKLILFFKSFVWLESGFEVSIRSSFSFAVNCGGNKEDAFCRGPLQQRQVGECHHCGSLPLGLQER